MSGVFAQATSVTRSQRKKLQRLGYAFCPLCLAEQRVIHVLWEWCFDCVTRCAIHRTPLQTGCHNCGESDPLTFGPSQGKPNPACWSCGDDLSHCTSPNNIWADEPTLRVVEDAYRAALLGVSSDLSLLGKVSHRAFRKFVDDMLQLLVSYADPKVISHETPPGIARHQHRVQLFILIADLISNAAPSSDVRCRRFRSTSVSLSYLVPSLGLSELLSLIDLQLLNIALHSLAQIGNQMIAVSDWNGGRRALPSSIGVQAGPNNRSGPYRTRRFASAVLKFRNASSPSGARFGL
jgi:hypothetical protein